MTQERPVSEAVSEERTLLLNVKRAGEDISEGWHAFGVAGAALSAKSLFYLTFHDRFDNPITEQMVFKRRDATSYRDIVVYVTPDVHRVKFFSASGFRADRDATFSIRPMRSGVAALHFLLTSSMSLKTRLLRDAMRRPLSLARHVRALLVDAARENRLSTWSYADWIRFFDDWSAFALPDGSFPSIAYAVCSERDESEALAATLRSLRRQPGEPRHVVIGPAAMAQRAERIAGLEADYVGILQAGEILAPHATALAAFALDRCGRPEIAICDDDEIDRAAVRHRPHFKPVPGHALMLSGTLARGLWLVRRGTLAAQPCPSGWAEDWRLRCWLDGYHRDQGRSSARLPYILSHRGPDVELAPAAVLADAVGSHLRRQGMPLTAMATYPTELALAARSAFPSIDCVIPSKLTSAESVSCIRSVLATTDYGNIAVRIALTQQGEPSALQASNFGKIAGKSTSLECVKAASFNFSATNNAIARGSSADYLLLLNDDVIPIRPDWLRWMVSLLDDPQVGVVGARLLYPDDTIQHAGVVMGLNGLCTHAHRGLARQDAGYMGRARLTQDVTVVTGACMLVRRSLYQRLGGLDEGYPSAFNDVDFCLRVREQGFSVVYAAQAELYHDESRTYGSHYAGDRAAFHEAEVARMRTRWAAVCADDPFYSPNLGLGSESEWRPAFPPRTFGPAR